MMTIVCTKMLTEKFLKVFPLGDGISMRRAPMFRQCGIRGDDRPLTWVDVSHRIEDVNPQEINKLSNSTIAYVFPGLLLGLFDWRGDEYHALGVSCEMVKRLKHVTTKLQPVYSDCQLSAIREVVDLLVESQELFDDVERNWLATHRMASIDPYE